MSRLAYITGASSGIGAALALRYYRAGYQLALVARRTDELACWAQQNGIAPQAHRIYQADVAAIPSIVDAGLRCLHEQGLPDVVIACAGVSVGVDTAIREDLEVMARTYAINSVGTAATFHPFIEPLLARHAATGQGGRLVGIASVAGIRGLPGHGAYCASKAAVISYCESLRGELRQSCARGDVRAVTICPGYVDTPLTQGNRYAMPFLMSPQAFADKAFVAIERGRSLAVIPWQMGVVAGALRLLPNPVFDRLLAGRPRKRRSDGT